MRKERKRELNHRIRGKQIYLERRKHLSQEQEIKVGDLKKR
jgi:hypothetical protein